MSDMKQFSERGGYTNPTEGHLFEIFSEASVGLCEISMDGRFMLVNKEMCRILGRSPAELLGRRIFDFTHPDDIAVSLAALRRLIETGEPLSFDERYIRADGSILWVSSGITRLSGKLQERPYTVIAVIVDVSDRKKAQEGIAAELASMTRLHRLSTQLTATRELTNLLQNVLDSVIELHRADCGHIQLYDQAQGSLTLAAHRGFEQDYLDRLAGANADSLFACGLVLRSRQAVIIEDVMTDARYEGLREVAAAAGYRAVQATPLLDRTGDLIGILSIHFRGTHRISEHELRMTDLYARQAADAIAAKLAEEALREGKQQLRSALDAARMGTWTWDTVKDRTKIDARTREILGTKPRLDHSFAAVMERNVHPEDASRVREALARAMDPSGAGRFELEFRWRRPDGGEIWLLQNGQAHFEPFGNSRRITGISGTLLDITERKLAEERQMLLMHEVNHRSKNILATIQAMISLSARSHDIVSDFAKTLQERIQSMSRVQQLAADKRWDEASLRRIVSAELAPYLGSRPDAAALDGEDVMLKPSAAVGLTMIIHELTTNAVKYGSLSSPHGRVHLFWRRMQDGALAIKWTETDGPTVTPPRKAGFGSLLIPRCLDGEVGGRVKMYFAPDGVVCDISLPAAQIVPQSKMSTAENGEESHLGAPPNNTGRQPLQMDPH